MKQILSGTRRKLIVAFALVAAVLTITGCSTDGTAPASRPAGLGAPPVIDPSVTGSSFGGISPSASLSSVDDDTLQAWKDREKDRITLEAVRSKPVYDSLHAVWNATHAKQGGRKRATSSTLAACEPQPYAADVQIVGPEGALFNVGPHKFYIPKGALTTPTVITVEAPVSNHSELTFYPHGLQFGTSYLMLDYHACDVGNSKWRNVVYTDDGYNILDAQPSYDQKNSSSVWGAIVHFSKYVVAID